MSYSKTIFFIPVWFDEYELFKYNMNSSALWTVVSKEKYMPRYLLHYATRIAETPNLFSLYEYKDCSKLNIYMFEEELNFKNIPVIENVRFSCFATGVGFIEFWVSYEDMSPEEIENFSYLFKKATKMCNKNIPNGQRALYDMATSIVPEKANAKLFFSTTAEFKYECICFHFLHIDEPNGNKEISKERLYRLSRSYNTGFESPTESDYDMIYMPSENDHWGGSAEGLVNIVYDKNHDENDCYLHIYKEEHLSIDYYFLYLLLLNQRFTAIQYINKIAINIHKNKSEDDEKLNKRIVELKTVFSFNVISADKIFQNVYSKMYTIFQIEHLLKDIVDNEAHMQILQNANSVRLEKLSSKFLFGISLLSLFSALIDASSYFDRIEPLKSIATILGFFCVSITVVICVILLIRGKKW